MEKHLAVLTDVTDVKDELEVVATCLETGLEVERAYAALEGYPGSLILGDPGEFVERVLHRLDSICPGWHEVVQ